MLRNSWTLYLIIPLLLYILAILPLETSIRLRRRFSKIMLALRALLSIVSIGKVNDGTSLDEILGALGYAYDPYQDIFYSVLYPWQREFGYCHLYDEAAAPMGMIIDCEPVCFECEGKKWMIEFWKGQYDMTTGCEVGVYTSAGPRLDIPGIFTGDFYDCADETDFLSMSYAAKRNGRTIFIRRGKHWWLTGFKLGLFSEPSQLSMYINITFKDRGMRNAFLAGLKAIGYSEGEFAAYRKTVSLLFSKPHSIQPYTRSEVTDAIVQGKNKLLCDRYQEAVRGCKTLQDRFKAIRLRAPELIGHITGLGRPRRLYDIYEKIRGAKHV